MTTNQEIVAKANEAFRKGNMQAFLDLCSDDFEWEMVGGDFHVKGKAHAIEQFKNMPECDPPAFSIEREFAANGRVMCEGFLTMKLPGDILWEAYYCDIYDLEEGMIKSLRTYAVEKKPAETDTNNQ